MSKRLSLYIRVLLAAFLLPLFSLAQKAITGHVVSKSDQSPIPGATVTIKGAHFGTSTAVDGSFSIKAKEGDVLVISGIGVVKQDQPVNAADLPIAVTPHARHLTHPVFTP